MTKIVSPRDLTRLRRLALCSQGLLQSSPFGRGIDGALAAITHLGYVQIDTISVVERAHHHALYSRVPTYQPSMLDTMLANRDIFEYWSHAAAFLPIDNFRFSLPYKQAIKSGQTHWHKTPDKKLMAKLLERIRVDGPLRSRDLDNTNKQRSGWWDWKPTKKALEQLYMEGDLMVSDRVGFQKTYDLTERVLPAQVNTQTPTTEEFAAHILAQQLRHHGLVSLKGLTYLRRNSELRGVIKALVYEGLARNALEQLHLSNGDIYIAEAGALERRLPRLTNRLLILSPFDNCVIQRERLKALFQYDYQIECYVPEAKRQYGYFCLPLLYHDAFIGRMDCKVHRKVRHLEIKSLYFEKNNFDRDSIITAFVAAIVQFCLFQKCDTVSLVRVLPKNLNRDLHSALKSTRTLLDS